MIEYWEGTGIPTTIHENESAIIFNNEHKDRIYNALFRGTNTLSPPDHDLIKLLEDMKK